MQLVSMASKSGHMTWLRAAYPGVGAAARIEALQDLVLTVPPHIEQIHFM
ncbi:MAG: hypothetical protein GWP08_19540 [Nitrospiraceae bacterium]|nr:hypothetical protein [Nitrospiraceae bacterium]